MTITIKLKTGNAAFGEYGDKYSEAHRIVADWLNNRIDPLRQHGSQSLYDYNGNKIGSITVTGR